MYSTEVIEFFIKFPLTRLLAAHHPSLHSLDLLNPPQTEEI